MKTVFICQFTNIQTYVFQNSISFTEFEHIHPNKETYCLLISPSTLNSKQVGRKEEVIQDFGGKSIWKDATRKT
jgi:hypothetical protein